jgi:hypothetical protein
MSARQCSLDGLSFTDILSNAVFLSPLTTSAELSSLLHCHLDAKMLTELMHEAAHHKSLISPLGHAWALLGFGVQRSGFAMNNTGNQLHVNQFANRYIHYLSTTIALRPLAEGLALFAEYDLIPPPTSDRRSFVCSVAEVLGSSFYPAGVRESLLDTKLFMSRLANFASKKAELLARPLDASNGGYLLGYLIVKAIWHRAMLHDPFFGIADNFLTFAMNLLYSDDGLVLLILDFDDNAESTPHEIGVKAISRALSSLQRVFDDPRLPAWREDVMSLRRSFLSTPRPTNPNSSVSSPDDPLVSLVCSPEEIKVADSIVKQWIGWQLKSEPLLRPFLPSGLSAVQDQIWSGRRYLRLMSIDTKWSLVGSRVELVGEGFQLTSEIVGFSSVESDAGDGHVELAFSFGLTAFLAFLTSGLSCGILTSLSSKLTEDDIPKILGDYGSSSRTRDHDSTWMTWVDETRERVMPRESWIEMEKGIVDSASHAYRTFLARYAAPSVNKAFLDKTGTDGLLQIFDETGEIGDLALASTIATIRPSLDQFKEGLKLYGVAEERIESFNQQYSKVASICAFDLTQPRITSRF